jgi:glycerol-3-phosphate acyltransferase PlsY
MSLDVTAVALSAGLGYLIGSLAFGYWIAKAKGVDIFSVGSKSPGATNLKRSVGKGAGNAVFVLDFLKGLVATGWPLLVYPNSGTTDAYGLIGLFAAVIGHSYSLFTGFRGGKGVASMLGGVVALMPIAALIGVIVWLAVFYSTRYVSVASILMATSLPVSNYFMRSTDALLWVSIALALVVIARHKSNIARLMRGEENRFEKKNDDSEESK